MSHDVRVVRCESVEEAVERCADLLANVIDADRTVRGHAHVALCGGSTVGAAYWL